MRLEIMTRWLEALRSGKYRQGKQYLAQRGDHKHIYYCCLGVLCELAVADGITSKRPWEHSASVIEFNGAESMPPHEVYVWADLPDNEAEELAEMNDAGAAFEYIADYIEQNL